jgi:hypothetical protein
MKKSVFMIAFILLVQVLPAQTYLNKIGVDFFSPYMVKTPKYNLPGNKYNPYMKSSGRSFGIFYERFFKNSSFSIKTGGYLNKQFGSVVSVDIPVEFKGDIFGKRASTTLFLGYTAEFGMNIMATVVKGSVFYPYEGKIVSFDISLKKTFYVEPYAGLYAGVNFGRFCFSAQGLFDFFVPEFITYKTVYKNDQGKEITEYNTNDNWGITIRAGAAYRF